MATFASERRGVYIGVFVASMSGRALCTGDA